MFKIYLKRKEGNEISNIKQTGKIIEVNNLNILNGCITFGNYTLPLANVLFIEEVE